MARNINKPVRMCVVCRERFAQTTLIRLQCVNGSLEPYLGAGRSFYLCHACVDHKKTPGHLARQCKSNGLEMLMNRLKEIIANDG